MPAGQASFIGVDPMSDFPSPLDIPFSALCFLFLASELSPPIFYSRAGDYWDQQWQKSTQHKTRHDEHTLEFLRCELDAAFLVFFLPFIMQGV
jgi:hypothetical protein